MTESTFSKAERLSSKILIGQLFGGGAKSFSVFPLRLIYMEAKADLNASVSVLISVPKKRFKKAVHRNRVKRQVREAYRKNKHDLVEMVESQNRKYMVSFVYLSDEMIPSDLLEKKVKMLLAQMLEKI